MLLWAFAKTIGGSFKRIQFTPDLLPSGLTGINFYNQKEGEFQFRPGPLFANIVPADEINNVQAWERGPEADIERCYSLARSVCEELEDRRVTYDFRVNAVVAGDASTPDYLGKGMGPAL